MRGDERCGLAAIINGFAIITTLIVAIFCYHLNEDNPGAMQGYLVVLIPVVGMLVTPIAVWGDRVGEIIKTVLDAIWGFLFRRDKED